MTDADYEDDLALLADTPALAQMVMMMWRKPLYYLTNITIRRLELVL